MKKKILVVALVSMQAYGMIWSRATALTIALVAGTGVGVTSFAMQEHPGFYLNELDAKQLIPASIAANGAGFALYGLLRCRCPRVLFPRIKYSIERLKILSDSNALQEIMAKTDDNAKISILSDVAASRLSEGYYDKTLGAFFKELSRAKQEGRDRKEDLCTLTTYRSYEWLEEDRARATQSLHELNEAEKQATLLLEELRKLPTYAFCTYSDPRITFADIDRKIKEFKILSNIDGLHNLLDKSDAEKTEALLNILIHRLPIAMRDNVFPKFTKELFAVQQAALDKKLHLQGLTVYKSYQWQDEDRVRAVQLLKELCDAESHAIFLMKELQKLPLYYNACSAWQQEQAAISAKQAEIYAKDAAEKAAGAQAMATIATVTSTVSMLNRSR